MTAKDIAWWSGQRSHLTQQLDSLAAAVRVHHPTLQYRLQQSENDVKPLDVLGVYSLPQHRDEQLIVSTMYTWSKGPLRRHCDIMQEDGPILDELPDQDLGREPDAGELAASIEEVLRFISRCEGVIVSRVNAY